MRGSPGCFYWRCWLGQEVTSNYFSEATSQCHHYHQQWRLFSKDWGYSSEFYVHLWRVALRGRLGGDEGKGQLVASCGGWAYGTWYKLEGSGHVLRASTCNAFTRLHATIDIYEGPECPTARLPSSTSPCTALATATMKCRHPTLFTHLCWTPSYLFNVLCKVQRKRWRSWSTPDRCDYKSWTDLFHCCLWKSTFLYRLLPAGSG